MNLFSRVKTQRIEDQCLFGVRQLFFDIFVAFGTKRRSRAFSLFTLYDLKYLKFARVWRYENLFELKTVEGTVTKFLGHRMFCVPKKRR